MPPARFVRLAEEVDAQLREIEQTPTSNPRCACAPRSCACPGVEGQWGRIATYTGRSAASVLRDLDRWEERVFEGLADGAAPGNPPRITEEVRVFMHEKLAEERIWNATQLAEVVAEAGLGVTPEAIRQHLVAMGFRWKRTRYVPSEAPDPEEEREARKELEALKKGLRKASSS